MQFLAYRDNPVLCHWFVPSGSNKSQLFQFTSNVCFLLQLFPGFQYYISLDKLCSVRDGLTKIRGTLSSNVYDVKSINN